MMRRSPLKPSTKPMKRSGFARKLVKPSMAAKAGAAAKVWSYTKVPPTSAEREWMAFVADFGCVACWWQFGVKTPCAVHHIVEGGRRIGHMMTIGLCDPGHHQNSPTAEMISRHPNKARFEAAYGTEYEMHAFLLARYRAAKGSKSC